MNRLYVATKQPISQFRYDPGRLDDVKPEKREAYMEEMKVFLDDEMCATKKDMGIPDDLTVIDGETFERAAHNGSNLGELVGEIRTVFKTELDKQVKKETSQEKETKLNDDTTVDKDDGKKEKKSKEYDDRDLYDEPEEEKVE